MDIQQDEKWKNEIESIFSALSTTLEAEATLKHSIHSEVKELDLVVRKTLSVLQQAHSKVSDINDICSKAKVHLSEAKGVFSKLRELVPATLVHKYKDYWKFSVSQLVFASTLIVWFESDRLIKPEEAASMIFPDDNSILELEDYLIGVSYLPSELSRLCVNYAVSKNYDKPKQIAAFVSELYAGFRLLNLKNDNLRKRYDSIKYDLKKIEEVVYDIAIRGLNNPTQ